MSVESESVWECRVNVVCEHVKEEPGLEHEAGVKEEPGLAHEARVKQETERGGGTAGLYADHEIKDELVLGPTVLQPPDIAIGPAVTLDNVTHISKPIAEGSGQRTGRSRRPGASCEDQFQPRACFVRLERLPANEVKHDNSTTLSAVVERKTNSEIELNGLFKDCAVSELYSCDTCGEQFARKRSLIKHIQHHSTLSHTQASTGSVPNIAQNDRCLGAIPMIPIRNNSKGSFISGKSKSLKQFLNKRSVKSNEKIHKSEKPYKCEECQKQFSQKNYLSMHRRIHTREKPHKLYKCEVCLKQFAVKYYLSIHRRIHTGEKPYKCDICHYQFSQSSHLHRHRRVHTGEKPYKCALCQEQFKERHQLITHEYIHTGEKPRKPYKCELCQKEFQVRRSLVRHEYIHTGESKCEICPKQLTSKHTVVAHVHNHAGKLYECDICSKRFSTRHGLIYHIQGHMGLRGTYHCAICGERFDKRVRLLRHARGHIWPSEHHEDGSRDGEHSTEPTGKEKGQNSIRSLRPGAGARCGDQLRLRPCSVRLQRLPSDEEKHASTTLSTCVKSQPSHEASAASELYSCDYCGEQFARKRNLILHIQLHSSDVHTQVPTGNSPDVVHDQIRSCPTAVLSVATKNSSAGLNQNSNDSCLKSSSNTKTLVTLTENSFVPYELGYTGERSLKCRYCMKRFYTQYEVARHERRHTGEKPYKCDICPKQFTVNWSLISHKRIHTGEKPHKCDICLMQFAQRCNLNNHKRIHTGERPYKCEFCTRRFIQRHALVAHERTHTGNKPFECDVCLKRFLRRYELKVHKRIHM